MQTSTRADVASTSAATVRAACGAVADALGRGGREGAENLKAALAAGAPASLACAAAGARSWAKGLPEPHDWRNSSVPLGEREAAAEALLRAIAALASTDDGVAACASCMKDERKDESKGKAKAKAEAADEEGDVDGASAAAGTGAGKAAAEESAKVESPRASLVALAVAELLRSPLVVFCSGGAAAGAAAVAALARSAEGAAQLVQAEVPEALTRLAEAAVVQSSASLASQVAAALGSVAARSATARAVLVSAEAGDALLALAAQPAVAESAEATSAVSEALAFL